MVRIGEDVSERLDIIPAEFFVHRHIRGKCCKKCCQTLVRNRWSRRSSTRHATA
jgi:transposase